ncbi:unnamed protein product [Heterobilharzia americana]|nr:unnamed protein product [Heterobilharzia americana]
MAENQQYNAMICRGPTPQRQNTSIIIDVIIHPVGDMGEDLEVVAITLEDLQKRGKLHHDGYRRDLSLN